ncbi:MAG TPA: transcription antitermination factor NusB [bacterium]|nr:transcription antitermination factor NusB [bacterium]
MSRRQGREAALKALFQVELGETEPNFALQQLVAEDQLTEYVADFARRLIEGVLDNQKEVDAVLTRFSTDWSLQRMANVDRMVLRLAAYELLFCPDIPAAVAINEAVELVKLYSTGKSGRFVNGILSSVARAKLAKGGKTNCDK